MRRLFIAISEVKAKKHAGTVRMVNMTNNNKTNSLRTYVCPADDSIIQFYDRNTKNVQLRSLGMRIGNNIIDNMANNSMKFNNILEEEFLLYELL